MEKAKFQIGQLVEFDKPSAAASRPRGPFEIRRVLPSDGRPSTTYRIKSSAEPFERSVNEYEIIAVG
jgi:hypothetical protein